MTLVDTARRELNCLIIGHRKRNSQGRTREFVPMNFHYALAGASLDSVVREIADSAI